MISRQRVSVSVGKGPFQAKMAPTMAAKSPAGPMLRALLRAPFWELPELVPGEVEGREEEEVVVGRTEVGVVMGLGGFALVVVTGGLVVGVVGMEDTVLLLEGCEGRGDAGGIEPELEQPGVPGWTVKGADWEVAPVWSRSNNPMDVPAGTATTQVNEVPVKLDQVKRAVPEGLLPGTTLKKKGPALP